MPDVLIWVAPQTGSRMREYLNAPAMGASLKAAVKILPARRRDPLTGVQFLSIITAGFVWTKAGRIHLKILII